MFLSPGVVRTAARECLKQQTGPLEVYYLCDALNAACNYFADGFDVTPDFLMGLATIIEPEKNRIRDYRHTPVTFNNGGSSAPHADIPRLIQNWCDIVNEYNKDENVLMDTITVKQLIRELLWVHPFKDGNGRLAFVLYNFLAGFAKFMREETLMFVYALPDFDWMN